LSFLVALLSFWSVWAQADTEVVVVGAHIAGQTEGEHRRTADKLVSVIERQRGLTAVPPDEVRSRIRGRGEQILDQALTGAGRQLLAEGRMFFEQADLEQARQKLNAALEHLRGAMAGTTDSRPFIDALLLLGMVNISMGDEDAARQAYKSVLRLDPARELDTVHYPPKVVALFDEVRDAVLAAPRATLQIVVADPQARVYVDGRRRGVGGASVTDLITGPHYVLVSSDAGYRSYAEVDVSPGAAKKITSKLHRRFVGRPHRDVAMRAGQVADMYRAVGDRVTVGLVLMAGETQSGMVGVQIFEPRTGNFSRVLSAPVDGDAASALMGLVRRVNTFVNDNGGLRSDQVGRQVLSMDIGSNSVLAEVLLDARDESQRALPPMADSDPYVPAAQRPRRPWYVWAGVGVLAAGATGAAFALQGDVPTTGGERKKTTTSNTGTVVVSSP
jgi:hypothetical protein